jgi:type II secretory ATPase GspE/PulE/Tfp pilus assembly ATPase PilB-like protein
MPADAILAGLLAETAAAADPAARVPELVASLCRNALSRGASDLHLEPTAAGVRVRLRVDGVLQEGGELPAALAPNLAARCKVLAGLLTYRTDIPQEGGAAGEAVGAKVDLRISTFPTVHGERIAVRFFTAGRGRRRLAELGLPGPVREALDRALRAPEGLVMLTGPCGSGKTTTLYACLREIQQQSGGGRCLVTVEDPVENVIEGVTQTAVKPGVGLDFARSLRSLLRQDPEVILVGEVRDRETAHAAVEATLTGHLVLSTVHAARAPLVPHRLLDMGVEPWALAGALTLAVAQRLARRLCAECRGAGCGGCAESGFDGRLLLAEHLPGGEGLHDAIMARAARRAFFALLPAPDLPAQAASAVAAGRTTAAESARILAGDPA